MARPDAQALPDRLMPSILDRLLGGDAGRDGYSLDEMYASVRRDLEELLNTHAPPDDFPEDCPRLRRSVAAYGVPDLTSLAMRSEREGVAVARLIEDILGRFEPRLRDIRVAQVPDADGAKQFLMRFQIEARLAVDPFPQVAFETVLELSTGRASVAAGG